MRHDAEAGSKDVLWICLASLVHHFDNLKQQLDVNHPLLVTPLFVMEDQQRELTLSKRLGPELGQQASGAAGHYSGMTVTGVPPHIAYMMQQFGYLAP